MLRGVGNRARRQIFRRCESCRADAIVGHSIVDIKAIRLAEIVTPIDGGGEHNVLDGAATLLRRRRRKYRVRRAIPSTIAKRI